MTTWILCPNLWGARLFHYGSPEQAADEIRFAREFPRPKIQTKLEDFPSDEEMAEIISPPEDPVVERLVANKYMKFLSRELEKACEKNLFESLILCAAPRPLSILVENLGTATKRRLRGTVDQDLYEANESDLMYYVTDIFQQHLSA